MIVETEGMLLSERMTLYVSIIVPTLFGIIIVIGLAGNALVVVVVCAIKQMRSTTNLLIINLAIADLLFIIFCVPFTASNYVLSSWPFGDVWCRIVQYLIVVTAHASIHTLVFMSMDRFLAVVHPIKSMSVRILSTTPSWPSACCGW
jgi:allatostatin A receptor